MLLLPGRPLVALKSRLSREVSLQALHVGQGVLEADCSEQWVIRETGVPVFVGFRSLARQSVEIHGEVDKLREVLVVVEHLPDSSIKIRIEIFFALAEAQISHWHVSELSVQWIRLNLPIKLIQRLVSLLEKVSHSDFLFESIRVVDIECFVLHANFLKQACQACCDALLLVLWQHDSVVGKCLQILHHGFGPFTRHLHRSHFLRCLHS